MGVRVGIIGCGGISGFHLRGYDEIGAEMVHFADANEARARGRASKYNAAFSTDYHKLLADPRVEAVSVCIPNHLHREVAEAALAAGKHVLCEKTMTSNLPDAKALVEAVEKSGLKFQVAYMKRFLPAVRKAKELVPKLGKLLSGTVRVYHSQSSLEMAGGDFWMMNPKIGGGGVLVHSASHMLDTMRFLAGDPVSVDSKVHMFKDIIDYYDTAYFQMEAGFTMFLEAAWLNFPTIGVRHNGWDERIEIVGEKGKLELYTMMWTSPEIEEPFVRFYSAEDREYREYHPEISDCFVDEVKAFADSIQSGKPTNPNVYDGYWVQAVIDAVYKSSAEGRRVDIERLQQ